MSEQKEVLAAAQAALKDAFGPDANKHTVKVSSSPSKFIETDIPQAVADQYKKHDSFSYDQIASKVREEHVFERPTEKEVADFKEELKKHPRELTQREIEKFFPHDSGKAWFPHRDDFQTSPIPNPIRNLDPILKQKGDGLTMSELNTIIGEVGGKSVNTTPIAKVIDACNQSTETPAKKKSIAESKKLIESFKQNLTNYPKHLSYEGSVVLCSLIGLNQNNNFSLSGLPKTDIDLIYSQFPAPEMLCTKNLVFSVELDDQQDFKIKCEEISPDKGVSPRVFKFRFFNSVIRPNTAPSDIPIEQDGNTVRVGNNLVLDQHRIQKLVGNAPPEKVKSEEDEPIRRQPVAGRNAFELRSDLVQMSIDLLMHNYGQSQIPPEKVVATAKILYSFVENRR